MAAKGRVKRPRFENGDVSKKILNQTQRLGLQTVSVWGALFLFSALFKILKFLIDVPAHSSKNWKNFILRA
ncbi:MAG: hypothetical protein ACR2H1_05695 [Limisphaerales bacterium]